MRRRRVIVATVFGAAAVWGCSLLATSEEDAKRDLVEVEGAGDATLRPDGSSGGGGDGGPSGDDGGGPQLVSCGNETCFACNESTCAGCRQNGASCDDDDDECCSGDCSSDRCGAPASACVAENAPCTSASSCCANLTCRAVGAADAGTRVCTKCASPGTSCTASTECCSGHCSAGVCAACLAKDQDCSSDGECCSGDCTHPKDTCN